MRNCLFLLFVFSVSIVWNTHAQQAASGVNVFEQLAKPDSTTGAAVNFHQDQRIDQLFLDRQMIRAGVETQGWRVQVFSSNVQQTARAEAFRIKALVENSFPEIGVYESFTAPFWRVRVGDFLSREEAEQKRTELRRAFPAIQREMVVVRDMIYLR